MAKSVISLHIGQAGIQIGQSLWQLYSAEHGLDRRGFAKEKCEKHELRDVFFDENSEGKFHPRLVYIDLEPSVIDHVQSFNNYNKSSLVIGQEDAANNYARGCYCTPDWFVHLCDEGLRNWMERVDVIQGLVLVHSICGGTGGGFGSSYISRLHDFFPDVFTFDFQLYPSAHLSTTVVEPFNALASINQLADKLDIVSIMDNESAVNINTKLFPDQTITHQHMNEVLSTFIAGCTSPLRFDGKMNVDIREYQTNLVPFQQLHYMIMGHAPWFSTNSKTSQADRTSIKTITNDLFNAQGWSVMCRPESGKYIAASLNYRGQISNQGINGALSGVRARHDVEFVDWSPTGFKIGMHGARPKVPNFWQLEITHNACTMLANQTTLRFVYRRIAKRFDQMFAKRAFLHWFQGAGMDVEEFMDARQFLMQLDLDYWDAQKVSTLSDED